MGDSFTIKGLRNAHPFFGPCGHGFGHPNRRHRPRHRQSPLQLEDLTRERIKALPKPALQELSVLLAAAFGLFVWVWWGIWSVPGAQQRL